MIEYKETDLMQYYLSNKDKDKITQDEFNKFIKRIENLANKDHEYIKIDKDNEEIPFMERNILNIDGNIVKVDDIKSFSDIEKEYDIKAVKYIKDAL